MYSKQCIFSAKVADRFAELAEIYPNMVVVSIDVGGRDHNVETYALKSIFLIYKPLLV